MSARDALLEIRIRASLRLMLTADALRRFFCARMTALVNSRSAAQVARMEKERGLI
jgi:hypothetical protein